MKILLISLFLPQEKAYHAGGRYVFEILKNLSRRHEISLATRLEEGESAHLETLRPFCREIYPYFYRGGEKRGTRDRIGLALNYLGFSRYANRLISRGGFDLVLVEWVEAALWIRRGRIPMILDAHDVITKPAERALRETKGIGRIPGWSRYAAVRAAESRIARRFDSVWTRSEYDRDYLLSFEPGLKIRVVPHPAGLDITERTFERRKNTILFLASFKHRKVNVDAALYFFHEVFPRVRKSVPDARFVIAGYGPPEELTSIPKKDPGVAVTGFVDDIDECYKRAAVFVAPILTGGGIIVKVLDAMAAGTPVVTTTFGNEGIGAVPERDLLVADDPGAFAEAVVGLLRDPELARRIAENGREFVRKNYGLDAVLDRIEASFAEIAVTP
jgi:glycosyltransferase involved in cell wall biosynthesis